MPILRKSPASIFTSQAIGISLVLAIVTADVFSISVLLGVFNAWEAAVAVYTVLTLSAGTIWTVLTFYRTSHTGIRGDDSSSAGKDHAK